MKDFYGQIQYKGRDYTLAFNFNVMEAVQEEYGTVEHWGELTDATDKEPNLKAVIFGFTEMLNEGIDIDNEEKGENTPFLTKKQVGRMITDIGLEEVAVQLNDTVVEAVKNEEKNA